ncbi:Protein Hook 3 [Balamuthia mandrillaris]
METKEHAQSLVNWVNTFVLSENCDYAEDLYDGVLLAEVFSQIAPGYLDPASIKRDTGNNWLLKVNNVKKLISALEAFYREELNVSEDFDVVNVNLLVKEKDVQEIILLVEFILGAAVECENKQEIIQNIMLLDKTSQKCLMVIIERLLQRHQSYTYGSGGMSRSPGLSLEEQEDLRVQRLKLEKAELQKLYDELQNDHNTIISDNANLRTELDGTLATVKSLERQLEELEKQNREMQRNALPEDNVLNKLSKQSREYEKEQNRALQLELDQKEEQILDLKRRVEELAPFAQESRKLRDEMDMMKEKVVAAAQTEEKFSRLQRKLEEMNILKKQFKELQQQNEAYMRRVLDLEEETSIIPVLRSQMEEAKLKLAAATIQTHTLAGHTEKRELEKEQIEEQHRQLLLELRNKEEELQTKNELVERLQRELEAKELEAAPSEDDTSFGSLHEVLTPEIKLKMVRLERENEKLKAAILETQQQTSSNGNIKNNTMNGEIISEARIKELEQQNKKHMEQAASLLKIVENYRQKEKAQKEKEKNELPMEGGAPSTNVTATTAIAATMMTPLTAEEHEALRKRLQTLEEQNKKLSADKLRLEGYLRTAKTMIRELRQQNKDTQSAELNSVRQTYENAIQMLKNQLHEKQRELDMHKNVLKESKECSEREQRLLVSAFYEMGLQLARAQAPKPDPSSFIHTNSNSISNNSNNPKSPARSFLASLRNTSRSS